MHIREMEKNLIGPLIGQIREKRYSPNPTVPDLYVLLMFFPFLGGCFHDAPILHDTLFKYFMYFIQVQVTFKYTCCLGTSNEHSTSGACAIKTVMTGTVT